MYRIWRILIASRLNDIAKPHKPRLYRIVKNWVMLFEALIGLLTLGLYSPTWTVNYMATIRIGIMAMQCATKNDMLYDDMIHEQIMAQNK